VASCGGAGAAPWPETPRRHYARAVIDLHCHVVPGIDDGPSTLEGSLELARMAVKAGVKTLVATPHVSWRYMNSPEIIGRGVEAVREAVRAEGLDLDIQQGAEIAVSRLDDLSDHDLARLRLGDGPWLLIEAPLNTGIGPLESILDAVHRRGHWIVLAHPERSPLFLRHPRRLHALVSKGVVCSITAGSLVGVFGPDVREFAFALVRERLVHNVTSDAHDASRRPPVIGGDIAAAIAHVPELAAAVDWMTEEVPGAILAGEPLPKRPVASDAARPRSRR
jgi:protein-tyrosine phosphatase